MHLSQLPSGHWRVAVKVHGTRRTATAPTEGLARLKGAQMEIELGAKRAPDTVTVAHLLDAHLATVDWSPTTRIDGLAVAEQIPQSFRTRNVSDIDAADIAALYRQLQHDGWTAHRIHRLRMVLSTAWTTAIEYRWATYNPVKDAKAPKLPHRDINPPTATQVDAILAAATAKFALFLKVAAATGLRRGELVALQWRDIAFKTLPGSSDPTETECPLRVRTTIRVRRSLVWTVEGRAERDTKTSVKGHRTLQIGTAVATALAEHHAGQVANANGDYTPTWVFSHAGATPWRPDYTSREFARTCRRAKVKGVRLHDVRHHVATSLLDDGVEVAKVSRQVGHSSIATTLRVYSHWIDDTDDTIATRLDR